MRPSPRYISPSLFNSVRATLKYVRLDDDHNNDEEKEKESLDEWNNLLPSVQLINLRGLKSNKAPP